MEIKIEFEGIASLAMLSVMTKEAQGNTVYLHVDNAGKLNLN